MNKAKDAVQHYTKTYAKKDNIEQGRGKAGSTTVYNTEVKRSPKRGTEQEKERNIVTDRTTYNPKTGNITESTVGQPNLDYKHADSKEKKVKGGYPRTKKEYGYNEATKSLVDQLLEKAITRPVSKMSNKEVDAYLGRKDKEVMSTQGDIPEMTDEEKKVRALDEKRAIKFEQQGKSMDDRTIDWLIKCHSHVLEGETEESLKRKKKQPEKATGHTLGTDPAPRSENEMVHVKEPDAYKSQQSLEKANKYKLDYDEDGMPQTPEAQAEFDERGRRNAAMHAGIKPKVPKGVEPREGEEVDKSLVSIVDELMEKAVLSTEAREKIPKKDFALPGGRYPIEDKIHARNALARVSQHGTPEEKATVRAKVHKKYPDIGDDDKKEKSLVSAVDELMIKARVAASKVRHVKLSPEKEKEITERADKKLKALKQSSYKPDYSRYANRMYKEEGGKSIDERTMDMHKSRERRQEIHDAVSTLRLMKHGEHEKAKEMNVKPEDLHNAAAKYNRYHQYTPRDLKSVVDTWKKDSSQITKGSVMGPGGERATLVKRKPSMYDKPLRKEEHGKRTPSYGQVEQKMDRRESDYREMKAKQRARDQGMYDGD